MIGDRSYVMRGKALIPGIPCPEASESTCATILYVDLHGYDALIEPLEPAEVALLLMALFETLKAVVLEHGGQVFAVHEAGLLAAFGVGDTRRAHTAAAFSAARVMQARFAPMRTAWQSHHCIDTALGIGIHRGEVALGRFGPAGACMLVGEASHGAMQLARRARAGEILLSATAHVMERRGDHIEMLRRLPPLVIRGRSAPLEVWCAGLGERLTMRPAWGGTRASLARRA